MKILILILVTTLISCSANDKNEASSFSDSLVHDTVISTGQKKEVHRGNNEKINFNVSKYKQGVDSLLNKIVGKESQTKLLIDTLVAGDLIFVELKKTPLANVTREAISCIKYSFPLVQGNSGLRHHFIILTFTTSDKADSVFTVFKQVAIEKSGVPGLTYSSDYLVQADSVIYWINSNCAYSYANHSKFVTILIDMINTAVKEEIKCECGKVLCTAS